MLEESGGLTEGSRMMRKRGKKKTSQLLNRNAALERRLIFVDFFLGMKDVDVQMCRVVSCARTRRSRLVSAHVGV